MTSLLDPARGYALWAPTYSAETAVSALEASVVGSLGESLTGRRVLDVGCGIARRLHDARDAGASLAVGVDLTPGMLAQASDEPLLAAADVRAIPAADSTFDVVWCRLVLGHLSSLAAAYTELARVCVPGGRVVVSDFHPEAAAAGHRRTFRGADGELREVEHHVHPPEAHLRAAESVGLALEQRCDRVAGDTVRGYYEHAGRMDAYHAQRTLPLVLVLAFARAA